MEYILKSSAIIALFYVFYKFLLQSETHFNLIRWFLISGIVLSVVLPLVVIPIYISINPSIISSVPVTNSLGANVLLETGKDNSIHISAILSYIYLAGILVLSIRLLLQLASLFLLIIKYRWKKNGTCYLIDIKENVTPFSFFNIIVFNSDQFKTAELDQIITHELVHAKQFHSIDSLVIQFLAILQWFNPFIWFYKKEIEQNLEYITDNITQKKVSCKKRYQQLLLKTSTQNYHLAITNNFYNSLLKKRILMLHKTRSSSKSQWKFALIIPLLLVFLFTFNTKTYAQNSKDTNEIIEIDSEVLELLISKKTSERDLTKIVDEFSNHGLKIKFSGVKRNKDNDITSIKIDAKATNGKASAAYAANTDNPIKPISISYDKENNSLSIGSQHSSGHEYHFSNSGGTKIIKRKGKKGHTEDIHIEVNDTENHDSNTTVWISKDGKTKKLSTKKEVIVEIDDDGNETKKEIIKIKKSKGGGANDVFILDEDDNDPNTKTTYIVNGKKMSKEEFKKMNKKDIRTIEIKKEVKKEKKN